MPETPKTISNSEATPIKSDIDGSKNQINELLLTNNSNNTTSQVLQLIES
jgi:hypothetical protein